MARRPRPGRPIYGDPGPTRGPTTTAAAPPIIPAPATPAPAPAAPVTPPAYSDIVPKYLGIPVPGGAGAVFPTYDPSAAYKPDYGMAPTYGTAAYTEGAGPQYETGPFQTSQALAERYGRATGTAADYTGTMPGEYELTGGYLASQLPRVAGMETLPYEEQFQRWLDAAAFEEERQAGGLREAMGSRGARYSSDLLTAENLMRQEFGARTRQEAATIQDRINRARLEEQAQVIGGLEHAGEARRLIEEQGTQRGFLAAESAEERGARLAGEERRLEQEATLEERRRTGELYTSAEERRRLASQTEREREAELFEAERKRAAEAQEMERQRQQAIELERAEVAGTAYSLAEQRAWAEYLMGRLPPDQIAALLGYATGFQPPGSVVTA
jgi:hypothetical protein